MPTDGDLVPIPANVINLLQVIEKGWRNLRFSPETFFDNAEKFGVWYWRTNTHLCATRKVMYQGHESEIRLRSLGNSLAPMLEINIALPVARKTVTKLEWYANGGVAVLIGRKKLSPQVWEPFLPALVALADEAKG